MNDDLLNRIESAIAALEAQRPLLGDSVVETALAALRQQLAGAAPSEQQLRQVSVLFVDMVGSTAVGGRLGPEDLHDVLDGALARFSAQVRAHRGTVLQYAGDSLLAAFGTPRAHEDDAERALLAGLAILAEARAQAAQLLARHGLAGFDVRVGVHTGPVLLGGGVDGGHTIRGLTVHIAARMEQAAPPGALRISHDTWRLVRGLFDATEQPPLPVKGRDEPMRTWLVERARPRGERRALRGIDGLQVPLVNRLDEMAALMACYHEVCHAARAPLRTVVLVGEAGLGKSRLCGEFRRRLGEADAVPAWLEAGAGERDAAQPYGLLRELFMRWLQIQDSDPLPLARRKWLDGTVALLRSEGDAAVLGHLLGLDFAGHAEVDGLRGDARQLRDRAFFHAAQLLRALTPADAPLLLLLDDLQWTDDGSLDFLECLRAAHADLRLLLVGLARPALLARRPAWADGRAPGWRQLPLAPLDGACSDALARALLCHLPEVPPALRTLIIDGAAGNPFYMEELVNMLLDRRVIVVTPEGWQLRPGALQALALPATLTGVLQARLDTLTPEALQLVQLAAVVGTVFWDDALRALGDAVEPRVLAELVERDYIVARAESSLDAGREYGFRHQALQQVAYERLLRHVKQPAHARLAHWLAQRPGVAPELVAQHYERGNEPARALDHWQRAAETAHARFALADALRHADRALALLAPDDLARRWALLYLRARVLDHQSAQQQLAPTLAELQAVAARLGRGDLHARALERLARHAFETGDAARALALAQQARSLADGADPECVAMAEALVFLALGRLGRYAEARAQAEPALLRAREAGLSRVEAVILNEMGNHHIDNGDLGAGIVHLERALALHRASGNRVDEAGTLCNLAFAAMTLGDYAGARQRFADSLAQSASIGHRKHEAIIHVNLGITLLNQGLLVLAQAHAQQALLLLREAGDRWGEAAALRVAGQVAGAQGERAPAQEWLRASCALFDALEMPHLALESMAALAQLAQDGGAVAEARAQVDAILARHARGVDLDGTDEPLRVRWVCWQVLQAAGDPRAADVLAQAWQELQQRAQRLADPALRQSFLEAVPFHRALGEAWRQRTATAAM